MDRMTIEDVRRMYDLRTFWPWYTGKQRIGGRGKYVMDRCPFHDDSNPSFLVFSDEGRCMACGVRADVFTCVQRERGMNFFDVVRYLAEASGKDVLADRRGRTVKLDLPRAGEEAAAPPPLCCDVLEEFRDIERHDIEGAPGLEWLDPRVAREFGLRMRDDYVMVPVWMDGVLANIRIYNPAMRARGPKWRCYDEGRGKQLYHSDGIEGGRVFVLEGEKDVWAARQIGLRAVATQGASSFSRAMSRRLDLADEVFVLGDNDRAGAKLNAKVATVYRMAIPVWWHHLDPDLPRGFDLADFVACGGSRAEFDAMVCRSIEVGSHDPERQACSAADL